MERGERNISVVNMVKVAGGLKVKLSELVRFYAALSKGLYSVFPSSDIHKRMAMSNLPDSFPQHRP